MAREGWRPNRIVTDMLVTNHMWGLQPPMGHREPTNLSGIQITCSTQYPGAPRFSGKEKPRSCSVSKSTIRPDQIHQQGISGTYVPIHTSKPLGARSQERPPSNRPEVYLIWESDGWSPRDHAGSRMVEGRQVDLAEPNLPIYILLIYLGRTQGYIRTLIHVSSLVLRLQSYIVTCDYLWNFRDSITWL